MSPVKPSSMLDDDALDHVGRVLARVDRVLEQRVDVLPLDDRRSASLPVREQVGDRLAPDRGRPRSRADGSRSSAGATSLKPLSFSSARTSSSHCWTMISACSLRGRRRRVDLVQEAGVGDLLDEVEDVVEAADQLVDVLAVERRDEGVLELVPDVVAQPVAPALEVAQLAGEPLALVVGAEELLEQSARRRGRSRRPRRRARRTSPRAE